MGSFFTSPSSSSSNKNSKKAASSKDKPAEIESLAGSENNDTLGTDNGSSQENQFFFRALWIILGTFVLMFFAFAVGFFISLRGAEKTVIPNVQQMELVNALIELQDKGLVPLIQVKYTSRSEDKGLVVAQTPSGGQNVKLGRRVTLTVSQGAVIEEVGDYKGMTLDDVKLELQTIFASFQTTIQVDQVIYQYDEAPEGEIIAQDPPAGSQVTGLTPLTLIVSRGMEEGVFKVENYTGYSYQEVLQQLAQQKTPFVFHIDENAPAQATSVVFKQVPAIGEMVDLGTPLEFFINPIRERTLSNMGDNMVFALFEYQLPRYLVPVKMRLERTIGATDPVVLFESYSAGGPLAIPYIEQNGAVLKLFMNEKEIITYHVP
ncbi:MAG: PASTA domain-containing protein [Spirochaetaceae bacterium]|jgi:beta-lactam-binding protein with PASTA domain|nr:PASTA domain-containing protein [Spirochaetaceae bacterium]